ncbi:metallophosphoesterase [Flavitalea sp. BT771]|uniref:metallophosphoesterase n=1 Tax=Flavitalea sp. BT771 TaxID=3063329 RepID=UPI0026E31879|nr:metallophosphoesterase [Flavitalea sp. BT771]MDO6432235.1 metallophosphoesterase [Flavitalea sp. BT771]MDV6221145.1 metallophosphoesterase [Flavitalea sp. BT771]
MRKILPLAHLLFAISLNGAAQQEKMRFVVRPYLQFATQHSIRVRWETSEMATTLVEYAPAGFRSGKVRFTQKISQPGTRLMHDVELEGLKPETNYFYRVSSILPGGDTLISEINPFRTAVNDSSAFAFSVFSDSQERPAVWGNITRLAERERPDFALHAGDLVDLGYIKKDWTDEFFAPAYDFMKKIPLYSILGNHEHDASWYYQYMYNPAPAYRYSFRYGNAEFFMVDTDQPIGPGSDMYNWLEQSLARSTATWKFVVHHYPPYSSDADDFGDTGMERSILGDEDARGLVPLYEKYGVDIVFDGHIHLYERTWPIRGNKVVDHDGVIYVTTGGAGGDTEIAAPTRSWFTNTVRTVHHFCYCAVNGNNLQFKAIDENGLLFDYFGLDRSRHATAAANIAPAAPVFPLERRVFPDTLSVFLDAALPDDTIRYTLDGSRPNASSPLYTKPILLDKTTTINIASFNRSGMSRINTATFALLKPYAATALHHPGQGLSYRYFTGQIKDQDLEKFQHCLFSAQGTVPVPAPSLIPHRRQYWGAIYEGFIKVPSDGYYKFEGHADHIFRLHIEHRLLMEELDQETNFTSGLYLKAGYHPIRIDYYDSRADRAFLEFYYSGPGIQRQPVPASAFFHLSTQND